jgi:phage terminase large subunit-like protein
LDSTAPDDGFFPFVCTPDEGDDWSAEDTWRKANPSYSTLINPAQMTQLAREATTIRSAKLSFFRFNLNIWPSTSLSGWLDANDLSKQGCGYVTNADRLLTVPERLRQAEVRLKDRYCYLGLDLALVNDLSVCAILFPPSYGSEIFEVLFKIWVPEENIERRSREHRVPYREWLDEGYLTATPGEVTDFSFIERDIVALRSKFTVVELGFDVALARDVIQRIGMCGMKITQVRQGFGLHPAIQRIEKLVKEGKLCLHGHPVAQWCYSNVVLNHGVRDSRFDKDKSREKIDCAVATACAFDVFLAAQQSVYASRGVLTI